jgi:hypothetical protein
VALLWVPYKPNIPDRLWSPKLGNNFSVFHLLSCGRSCGFGFSYDLDCRQFKDKHYVSLLMKHFWWSKFPTEQGRTWILPIYLFCFVNTYCCSLIMTDHKSSAYWLLWNINLFMYMEPLLYLPSRRQSLSILFRRLWIQFL